MDDDIARGRFAEVLGAVIVDVLEEPVRRFRNVGAGEEDVRRSDGGGVDPGRCGGRVAGHDVEHSRVGQRRPYQRGGRATRHRLVFQQCQPRAERLILGPGLHRGLTGREQITRADFPAAKKVARE